MRQHYSRALNRIAEEMEVVVAQIADVDREELLRLIERLEKLDSAYSWLTNHIPSGDPI